MYFLFFMFNCFSSSSNICITYIDTSINNDINLAFKSIVLSAIILGTVKETNIPNTDSTSLFETLNTILCIVSPIKYVITKYSINPYSAFIRTRSDVGNLEKESSGDDLNGKRINDLLDKILFKKEYPYIYDASIYMDKTESSVQLNINNIIDLKDIGEKDAEAEYNIFVNNGKLKIVYH